MKEIKKWYRTLEIAAHCMCDQSYDAKNLIHIAKYIERTSEVKANPIAAEIQETIDFHRSWNKRRK